MKRSAGVLLAAWLPGGAWALPASAAQPGHPAGWVLHTDIAAYIDGRAIPSYNIDGNTYTAAEDPAQFGFSVLQREGDGLFFILDRTGEATMQYVPVPSGKKSGSRACTCEDARALVILVGEPTKAVSVGGKISIPLDDLHCSCTSTPARTGGKTRTEAVLDMWEPTPEGAGHRDLWRDIHPYDMWMGYTSERDGWLMLTTYYSMSDGGEAWTRTYESEWRRYAVGAGFTEKYGLYARRSTSPCSAPPTAARRGVWNNTASHGIFAFCPTGRDRMRRAFLL